MKADKKQLCLFFVIAFVLGSLVGSYWLANQQPIKSLTNPIVEQQVTLIPPETFDSYDFFLVNDLAILQPHTEENPNSLENLILLYNISNPSSPNLLSQVSTESSISKIIGDHDTLYLISTNLLEGTDIRLIDVSNPLYPFSKGTITVPSDVSGIISNNTFFDVLLETGSILTFSKNSLKKVSEYQLQNISGKIIEYDVGDSVLAILDDSGIHIFERGNEGKFGLKGFIYTKSSVFQSFAIFADYIYYANESSRVYVFNITDRANIQTKKLDIKIQLSSAIIKILPINNTAFALVSEDSGVYIITHISHSIVQEVILVEKQYGKRKITIESNQKALFVARLGGTKEPIGIKIYPISTDFQTPLGKILPVITDLVSVTERGKDVFILRMQKFERAEKSISNESEINYLTVVESKALSQNFIFYKKAVFQDSFLFVIFNDSLQVFQVDYGKLALRLVQTVNNVSDFRVFSSLVFVMNSTNSMMISLFEINQEFQAESKNAPLEYLDSVTFDSQIQYFDGNNLQLVVLTNNSIVAHKLLREDKRYYFSTPILAHGVIIPRRLSFLPYVPFTLYREDIRVFYLTNRSDEKFAYAYLGIYSVKDSSIIIKQSSEFGIWKNGSSIFPVQIPVAIFYFNHATATVLYEFDSTFHITYMHESWPNINDAKYVEWAYFSHPRFFYDNYELILTDSSGAVLFSWNEYKTTLQLMINRVSLTITLAILINLPLFSYFSIKYLRKYFQNKKNIYEGKVRKRYEL